MRRGLVCGALSAVLVVAGMGFTSAANAAPPVTLYVSPAGTGDCTTPAAACALTTAVGRANADNNGDTVLVADGDYPIANLDMTGSMTLAAAAGAHPVLTGDPNDNGLQVDSGTTTIRGFTITNAAAGITTYSADLVAIADTTVSHGMVGVEDVGSLLSISGSTLTGNGSALARIATSSAQTGQTLTVTNSTLSNSANTGLLMTDLYSVTSVLLTGVTITGNVFGIDSEPRVAQTLRVGASVIAGNSRGDCVFNDDASLGDAGGNVVSDNTCTGLDEASSRANVGDVAVGLHALAANGSSGPQTEAIGPGSAAYHAVPVSLGLCPSTDERGLPRPGVGTTSCDAGAFETQTLTQSSATSGSVPTGAGHSGQLAVTGAANGPVAYATTSASSPVTVNPSGVTTAPTSIPAGTYPVSGTDTDPLGETGTWTFTLTVVAGALTQLAPTAGATPAGTAYTGQLAVSGANGPVSYTTAGPASPVSVSPSGVVTSAASVPSGTYSLHGTDTDSLGDIGPWSFTLSVVAGAITQAAPTAATTPAGTAFTGQLATSGGHGTVSYTTTSSPSPSPVSVSASGAITAAASTPAGVYTVSGTDTDPLGDTGTWAFTVTVTAGTLLQAAPTSGSTTAGTGFTDHLAVTGATGALTYATTSAAAPVTVSPAGTVTAPATVPAGVYTLTGTDVDALGDTGTWAYSLSVTAPGPTRADLSVKLAAPSTVNAGTAVTVTMTITNVGPSAASKVGTAILIPRGWTVDNTGGGILIGRQLDTFTTPTLAKGAGITYTLTLTSPHTGSAALLLTATGSVTPDPNYRNNAALTLIRTT